MPGDVVTIMVLVSGLVTALRAQPLADWSADNQERIWGTKMSPAARAYHRRMLQCVGALLFVAGSVGIIRIVLRSL